MLSHISKHSITKSLINPSNKSQCNSNNQRTNKRPSKRLPINTLATQSSRSISVSSFEPTSEAIGRRTQHTITQSHALIMNDIAPQKFPSKLWSFLTPHTQSPKSTKDSTSIITIDGPDDYFALLSNMVQYHHAQVYVPKSPHSNIFLPKSLLGQISTPINIEHVHKTISLPLSLSSLRKPLLLDQPELFADDIAIVDGKLVFNDTERLVFDLAWQSQSTQAPLGIDEYSLFSSIAMPESFFKHLNTIATTHPKFINSDVHHILQSRQLQHPMSQHDSSFSTQHEDRSQLQSHYFYPNQNPSYSTIRLNLLEHYGNTWRDGPSFSSVDFIPLLLLAWSTYTPQSQLGFSQMCTSAHPLASKSIVRFGTSNQENINAMENSKGFHYELLWFTLHSLSHPTNYLWDRLSLEFIGYEGSKEGINTMVDSF